MKDLRYVGLTAICIFLALATGLLLGSALGGPGAQEKVYTGLRQQFEVLGTENSRVREENDAIRRRIVSRDQAIRDLLPLAVRDRLSGATIGVVICGDWDVRRFWNDLDTAIRASDARIGPVLRIPDTLKPLDLNQRLRLASFWESGIVSEKPEPFEAATWATRALIRGNTSQRLEELARATGMELRGSTGQPIRRILLLTAIMDANRAAALSAGEVPETSVIDTAREETGIRIVVAEPEEALRSAVEPLRRRGISTVDNIDTANGQLSAVLALAGAEGSFGSKPGATRAIPLPEQP